MLSLLAIVGLAVIIGKVARRLTATVELALLLLIAGIVVLELLSWSSWEAGLSEVLGPLGGSVR